MANSELLVIDQAGATGPVNELFRRAIANDGLRMELGQVAATDESAVGARLGDIDPGCPERWVDRRLISLDQLSTSGEGQAVFSDLPREEAAEYEERLAVGRLVVTASAANRDRETVPLVHPFVNAEQIDALYANDALRGRIIASGNPMAAIIAIAAKPLHDRFGLRGMLAETLQGWSDTGAQHVPDDVDEVAPMSPDDPTWEELRTEPGKLLGSAPDAPADIRVVPTPNHGRWIRGHHAKITARLGEEVTKHDVEYAWRKHKVRGPLTSVKPELRALSQARGGDWPHRRDDLKPVKLVYHNLWQYGEGVDHMLPLRVKAHFQEVEASSPDRVTFEILADNQMIGAVAPNLMSIIYARAQGYLRVG